MFAYNCMAKKILKHKPNSRLKPSHSISMKKKVSGKLSGVMMFVIVVCVIFFIGIVIPLVGLYVENNKPEGQPLSYKYEHGMVLGSGTTADIGDLKKPSWWNVIPPDLQNFLELLYLYVFVYKQNSNMAHILNGVFGSSGPSGASGTSGATGPSGSMGGESVSLSFTYPSSGATVSPGNVNVTYTYTGDAMHHGTDHVHLWLDNEAEQRDMDFDGKFTFPNVTAGQHTLRGYLAKADHTKISGGEASITFNVGVGQPTSTPRPTVVPTVVPNGTASGGGLGTGTNANLEVGINLTRFNQLKAQAAQGMYDRACTDAEHDRTKWHSLVNEEAKCHYDHIHGDDPNYVTDIFGEPGAWFGKSGQSISHPWQTFPLGSTISDTEALLTTSVPGKMENEVKHHSYNWIVRRNQNCSNIRTAQIPSHRDTSEWCVRDFRVQFHGMSLYHEAATRWHSVAAEFRLCRGNPDANPNYNYAANCGIVRKGGWADFGVLNSRKPENGFISCNKDPILENPADQARALIYLDNEQQFDPIYPVGHPDRFRNYPPGIDSRFRCHGDMTSLVSSKPNGVSAFESGAEWWMRDPFRFQIISYDPISSISETSSGSKLLAPHFNCEPETYTDSNGKVKQRAKNPACRYNQSVLSSRVEYVLGVSEAFSVNGQFTPLDSDGNGFTDYSPKNGRTYYTNRFGAPKTAAQCPNGPGLDCIPEIWENVPLGSPGTKERSYHHRPCEGCEKVDHDLTPSGRSSWIDWFYSY